MISHVTMHSREVAFHGAVLAYVYFPALVAMLVSLAHKVAPVRFALAPVMETSESESIVACVVEARRLFSEAQRIDRDMQAITAYFSRYTAHVPSLQPTIAASDLRRRAVAMLARVVAPTDGGEQ